ncbi:FecR domain-containing protein [Chitinophaga varians]|uniref:FecR domain-containing protein n=1 Tax=Chitinophaga varians TaxID=2202339 RepID=UPI00165F4B83|nr:FecR domain-containing protein [Chitinophaga varians]MBC9911750.1 DUF4974 domain-containing protein [Chitinophaga varians]
MSQQKAADQALFRQYLDGECTKEQLLIIQQYLTDKAYTESIQSLMAAEWQQIQAEQHAVTPALQERYQLFLTKTNQTTPVRRLWAGWRRVAAAVTLLVLSGAAAYHWYTTSSKTTKVTGQWTLLENPPGKRSRILLPDSSIVYLAGGSKLRYPAGYGSNHRQLFLEGEAYFMVKHDTTPFKVTTGKITTVDVGTAFNIRFLKNQPEISIAVAEGVVDVVHASRQLASLTRLQQLRYNINTGVTKRTVLEHEAQIGSWREGILTFRNQPLREVAAELERYYGVTIRFVQPELADISMITTFRNVPLQEALNILSLTAMVHCKQEGNVVKISRMK